MHGPCFVVRIACIVSKSKTRITTPMLHYSISNSLYFKEQGLV
jgi:hypothetical protein